MTFFDITIYSQFNGAIRVMTSARSVEEANQFCLIGDAWIEGHYPDHIYRIDLETRQPVPLLKFQDVVTIETNRITGLPANTRGIINGSAFKAPEDGVIEVTVAYPQTFRNCIMLNPLYEAFIFELTCAPAA